MSRETDSIVTKWRNARLGGKVTSITSSAPGRASGTYHDRFATPSPTDRVGKGLAADFGDDSGDKPTATKLAIFNLFASDYGRVAELFYSHAPYYVKHGRKYPISQLNRSTFNLHKNHVHVAVPKGTFLSAGTPPAPAPLPITEIEDDMPKPNQVMAVCRTKSGKGTYVLQWDGGVITYGDAVFYGSEGGKPNPFGFVGIVLSPSGKGYYLVAQDGGVFAKGDAVFYGSYWNYPAERRLGNRLFADAQERSDEGYTILGEDGSWFDFNEDIARELGIPVPKRPVG